MTIKPKLVLRGLAIRGLVLGALVGCGLSSSLLEASWPVHADDCSTCQHGWRWGHLGQSKWGDQAFLSSDLLSSELLNPELATSQLWPDNRSVHGEPWQAAQLNLVADAGGLSNTYDNVTLPNRWAKLRYGPLQLTLIAPVHEAPTAVRFWHNGLPAHPDLIQAIGQWAPHVNPLSNQAHYEHTFQWNNPELGRINLQVEYKLGDRWSRLSAPLQLEIVPPLAPVVVAAGSDQAHLLPRDKRFGVLPCDSQLHVQFANLSDSNQVLTDIDGYGTLAAVVDSQGIARFNLSTLLTSGRYRLTFRHAISSEPHSMTSERSAAMWIDFHIATEQTFIDSEHAKLRHHVLNLWNAHSKPEAYAQDYETAIPGYATQLQTEYRSMLQFSHPVQQPQKDATKAKHSTIGRPSSPVMVSTMQDPVQGQSQGDAVQKDAFVPAPATTAPATTAPTTAPTTTPSATTAPATADTVTNTDVTGSPTASAQASTGTLPKAATGQTPSEHVTPVPVEYLNIERNLADLQQATSLLSRLQMDQRRIRQAIANFDYVTDVSFDTAATFPRRLYGPSAEEFSNSGLTILEGMRLQVAANGNYCLSFRYVPPQIPTTLQLQLQFSVDSDGPWQTITLAPIQLPTMRDLDKPSQEMTYVLEGHCSALERVAGDISAIRRKGSARFGYGLKSLQTAQNY